MRWMAVLLLSAATAATSIDKDRAALQAAEDRYTDGVRRGDVGLLDSVWADTFVDTDEAGTISTKKEQLAKVAASTAKILKLDVDQVRTDFYGNTAVVTARFQVSFVADGKTGTERGRSTDVWVKQGKEWKCVAAHSSAIAQN